MKKTLFMFIIGFFLCGTAFADWVVETKDWTPVEITVDSNAGTYVVPNPVSADVTNYYYTYDNGTHRCFTTERTDIVNGVEYKASSGSIWCYEVQ